MESGDVDNDVIFREVSEDPTHALEAGAELVDSSLDRDVELLDAARSDFAVGVDAVADLEVFDGGFESAVESLRVGRIRSDEVAGNPQS